MPESSHLGQDNKCQVLSMGAHRYPIVILEPTTSVLSFFLVEKILYLLIVAFRIKVHFLQIVFGYASYDFLISQTLLVHPSLHLLIATC